MTHDGQHTAGERWASLESVRANGVPYRAPVVALGTFDGVHVGHRAIVERAAAMARALGGTPMALTFDRHPADVIPGRPRVPLLTDLEERLERLADAGARLCVVATFDADFARMAPEGFIQDVLVGALGVRGAVCGNDFRFGRGAAGDAALLERWGEKLGFQVAVLEPVMRDGQRVSSSAIRERLSRGDVEGAAAFLGRPYALEGEVVPGQGQGRELGFPTANVALDPRRLLPGDGVYIARASGAGLPEGGHPALAVVSTRPTFGVHPRSLEIHLLDFSDDLYGKRLRVVFLRFLRGIVAFSGLAELREQIGRDVAMAREHAGWRHVR